MPGAHAFDGVLLYLFGRAVALGHFEHAHLSLIASIILQHFLQALWICIAQIISLPRIFSQIEKPPTFAYAWTASDLAGRSLQQTANFPTRAAISVAFYPSMQK